MRGVRWVLLAVLLVSIVGTGALGAKPVRTAHGEFWSFFHFMGAKYDVQVAFNVQAKGEDDHGTISIRYFNGETGKLVGVVVSTNIFPIYFEEDVIRFEAQLRAPKWDIPIPALGWAIFLAEDKGDADDFWVIAPITLALAPTRGKIVIRAFD